MTITLCLLLLLLLLLLLSILSLDSINHSANRFHHNTRTYLCTHTHTHTHATYTHSPYTPYPPNTHTTCTYILTLINTPHTHSAPNTHWIKYHWFCFYHTGVSQSGSIFAKGGASVCARMSNDDIAAFPNVSVVLQVWPRSFPGNNIIFFLIIVFLYLFADFSSFACAHWGKIFNHFNNQLF